MFKKKTIIDFSNNKEENKLTYENSENNKTNLLILYVIKMMEDFLMQADINQNSKKTYLKGLKKFINWAKYYGKDEINLIRKTIIEYKNFLTSSTLKPHTQAIYLTTIKQFFNWTESNLIFPNITKNIKGIKKITKQHHKDSLSKEEIILLINSFEKKTIIEKRDHAILDLLIFTGMRIGETTSITMSDIEKINEEKYIIWIKGKGRTGKDNFVILVDEVIENIKEYIAERKKDNKTNNNSYLFISHGSRNLNQNKLNTDSISRIVNTRIKKANLKTKRISPHSLRHSFGVAAIQSGVSLYELQIAMRHSSSTTTQVYLGDIENIKRKEADSETKVKNFFIKNNSEKK